MSSPKATSSVASRKVPGDRYRVVATLTLPSAYPSNGFDYSDITLFNLGGAVDSIQVSSSTSAGKPVFVDSVNKKIKVFSAIGTEVSNGVDLSTETLDVAVFGY